MMQDIKHSIVLITILLASLAQAHSWVEEVDLLAPDGKFTGTVGYPRGMILHSVPGFNDKNMQWQLPANQERQLTADMPMCRESQQTSNYTDPKLQKLVAYPGAAIGLRYQENGHVTTPWSKAGKPQNSGIVYVYGTDQPKEDDHLLDIHNKWTLDGKGGDGRGRLLTSQYFDDGQCYQLNIGYISEQRQAEFPRVAETGSSQGANLWCQTDVPLPKDLAVGKDYTLYWVWDWSTLGNDGKVTLPELYTTCIDVSVSDAGKVAGTGATVADGKDGSAVPFASVTNYGENAIQTVFENLAVMPTVPAAVTPAPVNVTASVSYAAAVTLIQNGAPTSAAVAAGNSAAAAWAVTAGTSGAAGAATTAGTTATVPAAPGPGGPTAGAMVGATTAPPPAASTTSIPATNPPPEPHPTGTGTGDCTSVTVTITIPSTQIQTVTVTATVPPQKAARSTGSLARRRVLALDDDHNDDDYDDDDDEFDS